MSKSHAEMIAEIVDAVVARLEAEAADDSGDGILATVKTIIRGDRAGVPPALPALWVMPSDGTLTHTETMTERWTLHIVIVAVVIMAADADTALRAATDMACEAMSALVADRRLGLDYVYDVRKTGLQFRPARSPDGQAGLMAVAGELDVHFTIRETEVTK